MRTLILDHYYPEFVASVYRATPGLERASFGDQQTALDAGLFGETQFQAAALRALGHEALHLPVNVPSLLSAFARENDLNLSRRATIEFRLRRGLIPWPAIGDGAAALDAVLPAIADRLEADLVHVQCMDVLSPEVVAQLKRPGRTITGQTAPPELPWRGLEPYDLVFSSLPNYVERLRLAGVRAALLPLAFASKVLDLVPSVERDVEVSFVGSISRAHQRRLELLEGVVAEGIPLDVWSAGRIEGARIHRPAWGRDMYRVLARSRATVNVHGENAAGNANNLRLYEATGMGTLLFTEAAPNLGTLFEPEREVVTYDDVPSLARALAYYLARPDEARAIAEAGRARTLRHHTWSVRMGEMLSHIDAT